MSDERNAPATDGRPCPQSRLARHYSRRRVVAGVGALAVGGVGVSLASREASAQVSVESLSVSDADFEAERVDPVVDVEIAYEYAVPNAEQVVVELLVGETVVADEALRTSSEELEQTTDLSGRVARSDAWTTSDFAVDRGERVERTIDVTLRLIVGTAGGDSVDADASDSATIVVEHPQEAASARIGGEGVIRDSND